jgi:hypothetical protein
MDPQRRIDVARGHGEEGAIGERRQPAADLPRERRRPPADRVVARVDRLEERVEMPRGPRGDGRRDDDNRLIPAHQPVFDRPVPAVDVGPDDDRRRLPPPLSDQTDEPVADRLRPRGVLDGVDDDADGGLRERLAPGHRVERVDPVEVLGHVAFLIWSGWHWWLLPTVSGR